MIKLFLFVLLVFPLVSEATTCVKDYAGTASCVENENTAGDCETLGYSSEDVDGCTNYLYCPFNTNYKKCVAGGNELNCEELGYTTDDKSAWCSNVIECPNDTAYTACAKIDECSIGDILYSDGSCSPLSSIIHYRAYTTPIGVVYALSEFKGGVPYTTENIYTSQHGRAIALRDLTSDSTEFTFDVNNPFDNSLECVYTGLRRIS